MLLKTAAITVSVVLRETLSSVAVTFVVPRPTAAARPPGATVATSGVSETQLTCAETSTVVPSE